MVFGDKRATIILDLQFDLPKREFVEPHYLPFLLWGDLEAKFLDVFVRQATLGLRLATRQTVGCKMSLFSITLAVIFSKLSQ